MKLALSRHSAASRCPSAGSMASHSKEPAWKWAVGALMVVISVAAASLVLGQAEKPKPKTKPRQLPSPSGAAYWIWHPEGNPTQDAPAETRYFRRVWEINRPTQIVVDEATLDITADNAFTVWVNGKLIGSGSNWTQVYHFDVKPHLVHGRNVIAVEARNDGGPAGLLVRLSYTPNGQTRLVLYSDGEWKSATKVSAGWQNLDYDDSQWQRVKVLGPYGKTDPWRQVTWGASERFQVPDGFNVEEVVPPDPTAAGIHTVGLDPKLPFSLINMCFDAQGRLLVSQERGPILLCTTEENGPPRFIVQTNSSNNANPSRPITRIRVYCDQVRNCQGMCWAEGALWLVGDGPQGTGLYRCRDTRGQDRVDQVELVHCFEGGMGEHGPHAILQGPDNQMYLVVGNHAWCRLDAEAAKRWPNPEKIAANSPLLRWPTGRQTPPQFQPGHTEDVLLPRQNDARGHAANICAPGGTIWRLDFSGKRMALMAAGFRNQFDLAFAPDGEMFTFDSDMEWDEGLPWYRPVRICHVIPGAEFGWRTGSSKLPPYYYDTLPAIIDVGRGSPVGLEWYDHHLFPPHYRTLYVSDWSLGIIYAVHLQRNGASYRGTVERFCTGAPMNVTDIAVGPDGALYFVLGGRGTQGGVYRIVPVTPPSSPTDPAGDVATLAEELLQRQPYSAFGRQTIAQALAKADTGKKLRDFWLAQLFDPAQPADKRVKIAWVLWQHGWRPDEAGLHKLAADQHPALRGLAVHLIGALGDGASIEGMRSLQAMLCRALHDSDPRVRRLACESYIRCGVLPEAQELWPLLGESDRFLRTAARLVLQRIPTSEWLPQLFQQPPTVVLEGIAALAKTGQIAPSADRLFGWLAGQLENDASWQDTQRVLDLLRATQLVALYSTARPDSAKVIARACWQRFPHPDPFVSRELAIVLVWAARENLITEPVHARLLEEMLKPETSRPQQIHYYYCLRLLHHGWTAEQKERLLRWYQNTHTWTGGHSFTPYLANIFQDLLPAFSPEEKQRILLRADELWLPAEVVLRHLKPEELPPPSQLAKVYRQLHTSGKLPKSSELKPTIVAALSRSLSPEAQAALREIADLDPSQRFTVAHALARAPRAENIPYLLQGLDSPVPAVVRDILVALQKAEYKPVIPQEPGPEHARPFRAVLVAAGRLEPKDRWQAVLVLRRWTGRQFTIEEGDWKTELDAWARWFAQTFPKEPPLPNVTAVTGESKWKLDELLALVEKVPKDRLDPNRGRAIFEKANCIKCHRFGALGEGIGPDLSTLKGRFTRRDTLEAILYPSKVISDQYRGSVILTKNGQTFTGLAAPQGDTITVLQQDGTRVTLRKDEIEQMVASTISPMPDKLLDNLTVEEIADLLAFLESDPPKK